MSRKSIILALPVAIAVALIGACSGEHDQGSSEADQAPVTAPASEQPEDDQVSAEAEHGLEADQAPVTAPAPGQADEDDQVSAEAEPSPTAEQDSVTAPTTSAQPDAYGRLPGDPHYGHDHPPGEQAPVAAPAPGQPDAYGRPPGDPHYGHSHP